MYCIKRRCIIIVVYFIITFNLSLALKDGIVIDENIKRVNVLIIMVDDLRHLTDKNVIVPNIKLLARKGVDFKQAFAQQALCAPSRNSILTGRRPDTLHLYDFYSYWRDAVSNFTTLPQLFKESGYNTYSIGKVFHPGISSNYTDDYPYSWTKKPYHPPTEAFKDAAVCFNSATKRLERDLVCPVDVAKQPRHMLPDMQSLKRAMRVLKKAKRSNKPFFLAVGFHKPHIPLKFPEQYLEKYPMDTISPPEVPFIPEGMPTVAYHPWTDVRGRDDIARLNISFPFGVMPSNWARRIKQSYYGATTYIDTLVGQLVDNVELNNTVVVLTSDHGWSLGENGLWAKYSNFEEALKVPLILLVPKLKPKQIYTPVELIDIFPTLVDVAKLKTDIPKCDGRTVDLCFEGKSLLPMMSDQKEIDLHGYTEGYVALSQYPRPSVRPKRNSDKPRLKNIKIMGYSLRTNRFRYTEWISFNNKHFIRNWDKVYGVELYDHSVDLFESNNLYKAPAFKDLVQHFSLLLRTKVNKIPF